MSSMHGSLIGGHLLPILNPSYCSFWGHQGINVKLRTGHWFCFWINVAINSSIMFACVSSFFPLIRKSSKISSSEILLSHADSFSFFFFFPPLRARSGKILSSKILVSHADSFSFLFSHHFPFVVVLCPLIQIFLFWCFSRLSDVEHR